MAITKKNAFLLLILFAFSVFSQTDSSNFSLKISGYVETYYCYDFANPENHIRPSFAYSFNRHNEVNLNLGFIKASYETKNVRANLALMAGTYANANLAAESGVLKNIFEGNVGVKIAKKKNIWVDAGVFAAHIGFESANGKDCWTLTRSLMADNSPYYESGVKITYVSDNDKWLLCGLVLNGWQRIQRLDGNNMPAFGHQVTFKPNSKIVLNSSSFIGSDSPDSARLMRYFHNFYAEIHLHKKIALLAGFDIGAQQKTKGSSKYSNWYTPNLILKFSPTNKVSFAARAEYYFDDNQVIITTGTAHGFQTYGYSLNLDYSFTDAVKWRIEGRGFNASDKLFMMNKKATNQNYFMTTSLAIAF